MKNKTKITLEIPMLFKKAYIKTSWIKSNETLQLPMIANRAIVQVPTNKKTSTFTHQTCEPSRMLIYGCNQRD